LPNNSDAIDNYTESVADLLDNGITYNGKTYSIEGYDIDYESYSDSAANVVSYVSDIVLSLN